MESEHVMASVAAERTVVPQFTQFIEIDPLQGAWQLEQERQALPKRSGSKFHCLLQRRSFGRPTRPEPSGKSKNKIEDKWVKCDGCGRKRGTHTCWCVKWMFVAWWLAILVYEGGKMSATMRPNAD